MYGKSFASMYDGSLFGSPSVVFAVWGYAISKQRPNKDGTHTVELNPRLLAATFAGETIDTINGAIDHLCAPDSASRTPEEDGRRLIADDRNREGPSQYTVVNGAKYRAMRDEEERRSYLRDAQRAHRAKGKKKPSTAVNHGQPPSTQAEAEAEVDSEAETDQREEAEASPIGEPRTPEAKLWHAWETLCGSHQGSRDASLKRLKQVWPACEERDPADPVRVFVAAATSFRADPNVKRKRLGLPVLCAQFGTWADSQAQESDHDARIRKRNAAEADDERIRRLAGV